LKHQFVCVRWGTKYSAAYVNRLHKMIARQMRADFVLYCLTDDSRDLDPDIQVLPIRDNNLSGWWHKLSLFRNDFYGLSGDLLYTDLDVVIVDRLDDFFSYCPGEFLISQDLLTGAFNSSVFRFRVGSQTQIWDSFAEQAEQVMHDYKGDQDWITKQVINPQLWPAPWVVSFKKQCNSRIERSYGRIGMLLRHLGLMSVKGEAIIPQQAKIIQFHGKPDPEDVMNGPYNIYRHAPWIRKYWH
jgi:hypothetical protein